MKKSPFILGLSLAAVFALTGCNNTANDQAILNRLSGQLDRVVNTVASVSTTNEGNLSISNVSKQFSSMPSESFSRLSNAYQSAKTIATTIEDNKELVLRKVKIIKKEIAGGLELGNENAKAISELTSAMQRYTTSLNKTKSDYKNTVKSIAKVNDSTQLDAKITRLSCCLEARDCYLKNIIMSLDNIQSILDAAENNQAENGEQTDNSEVNNSSDSENKDNNAITIDTDKLLRDMLEERLRNGNCPDRNCFTPNNCPDGNCYSNGNCPDGYCPPSQNTGIAPQSAPIKDSNVQEAEAPIYNGYNFNYGYGGYPNGYNNGYGQYGYGNGYYGNSMFNPNRNTDTYGPGVTNIDTYRGYGNGAFGGYGANRHFGGSNGINNVDPIDDMAPAPIIEPKAEEEASPITEQINSVEKQVETPVLEVKAEESVAQTEPVRHNTNKKQSPAQKSARAKHSKPEVAQDMEQPKAAAEVTETSLQQVENVTEEITEELKVKSVIAEPIIEEAKTDEDGEDKVKGHTQTVAALMDVNKEIEKLIKG